MTNTRPIHAHRPSVRLHLVTVWLLAACMAGPYAQAPAPQFLHISKASLDGMEQQLTTRLAATTDTTTAVNMPLSADLTNQRTLMFKRDVASLGEIHEGYSDFGIVRSGTGTVVMGGKVVDGKFREPGELFGPSIDAGTRRAIAPADVIYIAQGTAHQFVPDAGSALHVLLFRFPLK